MEETQCFFNCRCSGRGGTYVDFNKQSNSEEVAAVVVLTVLIYLQKGLNKLTVLFDNARIHGSKMEKRVNELLAEMTLPEYSLNDWHTPRYSPELNQLNILFMLYFEMGCITFHAL